MQYYDNNADARAENEYDEEAVETHAEVNQWDAATPRKRRIIDADGDGVEDNQHIDRYELDRFYKPAVFHPVEEMHNTHNGELPGHVRFGEGHEPGKDPWAAERAKEA